MRARAVGNHLLIEKLPKNGVTSHARGRITSVGPLCPKDFEVGQTIVYIAGMAETIRGVTVLMNPKESVKAIDPREGLNEVAHVCFAGLEQPGTKEECDICIATKGQSIDLKNDVSLSSKLRPGKRDLPPEFLEDLHTGKITKEEARDVFGVPIADHEIIV